MHQPKRIVLLAFSMTLFTTLCLVSQARAQAAETRPATAPAGSSASPGAADRLSDADLEELLAPIALYPDPLLANVLAASCYPEEILAAAKANGNDAIISGADWEPPVKAIAKAPDALKMMSQYPDWTRAVGEAFVLQSQDVMAAVQRLRARAQDNGALKTTEQQVVHTQSDVVVIEPADPQVIYVPDYDPDVVYVDHDDDDWVEGAIGFGIGITTGLILANNIDCDWHHGGCSWGGGWGGGHNDIDIETGDINIDRSNTNNINNIKNNGNQWKPNQNKLSSDVRAGRSSSMQNFKGSGSAQGARASGRVPGRSTNAKPIADRAAPRPSQPSAANRAGDRDGNRGDAGGNRGGDRAGAGGDRGGAGGVNKPAGQPTKRPGDSAKQPKAKGKPSIPPADKRPPSNSSKGSKGSKASGSKKSGSSAYGGSGGSSKKASSRGSSSRKSSGGGGGGSRGGGSRGGGGRGGGGRR